MQMNTFPNARRNGAIWASVALAVFVSLAAGANLAAQAAAPPEPRFEVVSIKRNTGGRLGPNDRPAWGPTVRVRSISVQQIIWRVYGIQSFQLTGGPDWLQRELYDIEA